MLAQRLRRWANIKTTLGRRLVFVVKMVQHSLVGAEEVYLPLCKVADAPFHIQGDDILTCWAQDYRSEHLTINLMTELQAAIIMSPLELASPIVHI